MHHSSVSAAPPPTPASEERLAVREPCAGGHAGVAAEAAMGQEPESAPGRLAGQHHDAGPVSAGAHKINARGDRVGGIRDVPAGHPTSSLNHELDTRDNPSGQVEYAALTGVTIID